ncbi:outer membrane protein assembly factor BamD [Portibacter marinus]|uniref:hypothetical protein n=1 Tax=Portibacter marinus TaxID=2898660 RepID=UPI001F471BA0|nr:hypothetical protein [Portibacter marinus]
MQNLKFYRALNRLSIYDLNRFKKFIYSPYFNQNEKLINLFDFYYQEIKKGETEDYTKEQIWKKVFKQEGFKDSRFRKYNTDLLSLLEQFLSVEQFKAQPLKESTSLLEAVIDNKMPELYNSVLKTTERLSERHLERNANYYFYQYMAEKHRFNLTSEFEKKSASKSKIQFYNIQDINDNLDYFFIAEKLRYYCSMLSWKNVVKHDIELLFIEDIVELVKDKKYYNIPTIGIYYQIYLTTIEPEEVEHYYKLKELIQKNLNLFPQQEAKHIFDAALNYCVRKVNKGMKNFNSELLTIYNEGLEKEVLLVNGEITPTSFRNICIIGLRLGDIEWVEKFIKEYAQKINPKYRANALQFNLARVALFKKDYDGLIDLLNEVEFDDLVYTLDSKLMLIIAYYEMNNKDLAQSSVNAFKVFLVRHKNIPDQYKLIFGNFNSYIEKIMKLAYSKPKLKKLKDDLARDGSVASRNWLVEKIDELL